MGNWIVEKNYIHDNNGPNNAPPGSLSADLPIGGGILILGVDDNQIRKNRIENNVFFGIATVDWCLAQSFGDFNCDDNPPITEPYPDNNVVTRNTLINNGTAPPPHPAAALASKLVGASAPRMAEQYLSQIEMFFAALAWYLDEYPDRSNELLGQYRDTQCGLKAFRADVARQIFEHSRIDGFAFDVEVFFLVEQYHLSLAEVPVRVENSTRSTVRVVRDAARLVRDLFRIRSWAHQGLYDLAAGDTDLFESR